MKGNAVQLGFKGRSCWRTEENQWGLICVTHKVSISNILEDIVKRHNLNLMKTKMAALVTRQTHVSSETRNASQVYLLQLLLMLCQGAV